jgi:drug/metabolite transporter (DMT)-like permease
LRLTEPQKGHLAMLAFSALVAGSFSLGAMAAPFVDPAALTVLRFALAGAMVGAVALATTGIARATWVAPWRYVLLGGLLSAYFVLMFKGLQTAQPVSTAAVFTLTPLMAAGFGWLFLRQITLRLPSAKVMAYTYLVPSWVILWEIGLGHGAPPLLILAGVAMTTLALLLLVKDETKAPSKATSDTG